MNRARPISVLQALDVMRSNDSGIGARVIGNLPTDFGS